MANLKTARRQLDQKPAQDETRQKIMDAAGEVFAETGYQAATVRDICARAGVNIAAINYYFGDKLGLYTEALKAVVAKSHKNAFEAPSSALPPERALHEFLLQMLQRMTQADRPAWYTKVMIHELAQPTPALAVAVEQVIRPKARILCGIVAQIIERTPQDPTTRLCALSIIGQVIHYVHAQPVTALLWPELKLTPKRVEVIAKHITDFSLKGMKGLKRKIGPGEVSRKRTAR